MAPAPTRKVGGRARRPQKSVAARRDDHPILIIYHGVGNSSSHASITRQLVHDVIGQLGGLSGATDRRPRIDVWLDSPGGDAHAAYKLGMFLRARFTVVNVVVPDFAKSAATLIALAGDSIFMGCCAELGPLDMQEIREGEMRLRSALDTADSVEHLFQRAINNVLVAGGQVLSATRLSREKALSQVLEFAAGFIRPLVEQLDPLSIHAATTGLYVTVEYGKRLLQLRNPSLSEEELERRAHQLVRGYPSHGFVIDRHEAREALALPVHDLENYDLHQEAELWYNIARDSNVNLVRVVKKSELNPEENQENGAVAGAAINGGQERGRNGHART